MHLPEPLLSVVCQRGLTCMMLDVFHAMHLCRCKRTIANSCADTCSRGQRRCPLMIDPQGQGVAWVRRRGLGAGLSQADMYTTVRKVRAGEKTLLEDCLAAGRHMLLENVCCDMDMDAALDSVIRGRAVNNSKRVTISLGAREVEYTPTFRLFLSCPLPNPCFSAEISAHVALVDFSLTLQGLQRQLLDVVLDIDNTEVQKQRVQVDASCATIFIGRVVR
jgi:dynein heavy chain